jgi:hypothetical protein
VLHGTRGDGEPQRPGGGTTATTLTAGTAEREAAEALIGKLRGGYRFTLGADNAYDTADFVAEMRRQGVTPHVTQNKKRCRSAIDGRTTRHARSRGNQHIRDGSRCRRRRRGFGRNRVVVPVKNDRAGAFSEQIGLDCCYFLPLVPSRSRFEGRYNHLFLTSRPASVGSKFISDICGSRWISGVPLGEIMFVPPYDLLMRQVDVDPEDGNRSDEVTLSRKLLDFFLRCLLAHAPFDEKQYRRCNPDVAEAIRKREIPSGREHFITVGYFEGRTGGIPVHEQWYLARNPDVAAAKRAGDVESGEMQYRIAGAKEWREPNPEAVDQVKAWKTLLER